MLTHSIAKHTAYDHVLLQGRIDGMTAPELEQILSTIITNGGRNICVNLEKIHYISSVGLRVFLRIQKQLARAAGKIVIQNPSEEVLQVFTMSGFDRLFVIKTGECQYFFADSSQKKTQERQWNQLKIIEETQSENPGKLRSFGNVVPQETASYTDHDVVDIPPEEITFGCGLAALGSNFSSYSSYFGESLVLNNTCLVYPAAPHAAVDMMLGGTAPYHFLQGFGFCGSFNHVAFLEHQSGFVTLQHIIQFVQDAATTPFCGVVIMGELKGLWGMNLRKVPLKTNNPENHTILDAEHFTSWMNFPIEPGDFDTLLLGCGVIKKSNASIPNAWKDILPQNTDAHIHGAVFTDAILNKTLGSFAEEINTIVREAECTKVQHLLSKTCFSSVLVGIVPLKEA